MSEDIIAGAANLWAHDYAHQIAERAVMKLHEHGYEITKSFARRYTERAASRSDSDNYLDNQA